MSFAKYILVFAALSTLSSTAAANNVGLLNEKVDELELEMDVEDMEAYGDLATVEDNQRESDRLQSEARDLEREIDKLKKQAKKNETQKKSLQALYLKRDKLARDARTRAARAEAQSKKAQANVDALRARVDSREKEAVKSLEIRKNAENEVTRQVRIEKTLKKRLQAANRIIKNNKAKEQQVKARANRLAKNNKTLERQTLNKERQAIRTAGR